MNTPEQIQKAALDHERPMIMPAIRAAVAQADSEYNEEINKAFAAGAQWMQEQYRWRKITKELPPVNEEILCYDQDMGRYTDVFLGKSGDILQFKRFPIPSHWTYINQTPDPC